MRTLTSWNLLGHSRTVKGLLYLLPLPHLKRFLACSTSQRAEIKQRNYMCCLSKCSSACSCILSHYYSIFIQLHRNMFSPSSNNNKKNSLSWIHEVQDRDKRWEVVSSAMKFKVSLKTLNFLTNTHTLPVLKKESPSLTYMWQYPCRVFFPFCPCKGRGSTSHIINTSSSFTRTTVPLPLARSHTLVARCSERTHDLAPNRIISDKLWIATSWSR